MSSLNEVLLVKNGFKAGYILESEGSILYYFKRAHLGLYLQKSLSNNSVLKKKGTFFINITMGSIQ